MSSGLEAVAVAIDTAERRELTRLCRRFGPRVGVLKIGLQAYTALGPAAVEVARRYGRRVFLDLKLHDIPNTVAGAVRAAAGLGVDYLTIHAGGGRAMMMAARAAAGDGPALLGVTVLTHLDGKELAALGLGEAAGRVEAWARMARAAGLAGVVCSPQELARLRPLLRRPFALVTPGIRWAADGGADDQRRVASPEQALGAGADLLVIGRPLTAAPDPDVALAELAARLAAVATRRRPARRPGAGTSSRAGRGSSRPVR